MGEWVCSAIQHQMLVERYIGGTEPRWTVSSTFWTAGSNYLSETNLGPLSEIKRANCDRT